MSRASKGAMISGRWLRRARGLLAWCVGMMGGAVVWANTEAPGNRDTLVYKDGDRVHGVLVQEAGGTIVFKSDRFGELRVPAKDAVVIKGDRSLPKPAAVAATPPPPGGVAARGVPKPKSADAEEEERMTIWDRFSPAVLTAKIRNTFGPWHGRLSFSSEVVSDTTDRNNSAYEGTLQRKWKADEVRFSLRFDYNETDDVATTDMVRASGQWRHTFNKTVFAQYRPSGEWNRASRVRGQANDYMLLQQELGAGFHLLTKPTRSFRVGLSQNLFDRWTLEPTRTHDSRGVISTFQEADLTLPWRITISQRGVWYPVQDQKDGWENRVELNKKLTETLSTSVRHEIRRNNPDGTAQDYTRLRLMFGLDF
jgi:hypothetical protein